MLSVKRSSRTHGLKYSYLVGDRDSSVYLKKFEVMPYAPEDVKEMNAFNNVSRNYRHNGHISTSERF
jgi:hypothetical protein